MAPTRIDEVAGLTAADIVHARFQTTPATATVGDVRDWFAHSASRRMALLVDEAGRYAGSLTREHVSGEIDPTRPAVEVAHDGPTVLPEAPAAEGRDLALLTDALRVPVVDRQGALRGVVCVTADRTAFCGTG